jgi:uncharacterized membrane protein (DUF4010 family)
VSLGFAERSREQPRMAAHLALGILLAWTVMFVRVVVMVGVVAPSLASRLALAIATLAIPCLAFVFLLRRRAQGAGTASVAAGENPFELGQAIRFGLLFGVVTFLAKAAQVYLGDAGLYLAGAVAGLTDVDAIALSMANLAQSDAGAASAAARTILIAVLSNTLVKGGMAMFLGAAELRRAMTLPVAVIVAAGVLGALFLV